MDFMEMREALSVAGYLTANGNQEGFYGARPVAAIRAMARPASVETSVRHAASAADIEHAPRIARANKRKPG